jgi:hypothetical protein
MAAIAQSNRISLDIPADDLQAIVAAMGVLQEKLLPHLVDLGPEDRRALPKMGSRTVDFVAKALKYARENPEFRPGFVDLDEFQRDYAAVDLLRGLQRPMSQLADMMEDSMLLAGSEAFGAALSYYQATQAAARRGHPGAAVIAKDLGLQFASRGSRPAAAPLPGAATAPSPALPPRAAD